MKPKTVDNHVFPYSGEQTTGLTKKEYFAAIAMQALLTQGVIDPNDHSDEGVDMLAYAVAQIVNQTLARLEQE